MSEVTKNQPLDGTVDSPFFDPITGFDFDDLQPVSMPVKYQNKQLVVREAVGGAVVSYRNAAMRSARMEDAKVVGINGLADSEPILVAACLFEIHPTVIVNGTPMEKPVTVDFVKKMPYRMMKTLYDWIKKVSDIDEGETEETLLKQKTEIDKKLEKLRKNREENTSAPKGGPKDMTDGSA